MTSTVSLPGIRNESDNCPTPVAYRGRLAPSPTGYLHLGHARTFWIAQERARQHRGKLVLRNENLDRSRVRKEFVEAMLVDLAWIGIEWAEGPDCGGSLGPYHQSQRLDHYARAFKQLLESHHLYPCSCSRKDILQALSAPHESDDEPIYPGTCRLPVRTGVRSSVRRPPLARSARPSAARVNWRFRVPDGEAISFIDGREGPKTYVAGRDFGDFIVWRYDGLPSYQLAVVVDDHAMRITEVVRGSDLLRSTARQLLLYRALGHTPPAFFHCPLLTDANGVRLAKRNDALSLRALRNQDRSPAELRAAFLSSIQL